MDALILSRWQFAITTVYHFLFVPVTLGLSIFVALLETCYVRTKRPAWKETSRKLVRFFGTLFIINFSMGVVTGIVQEFHFGMNWSEYSRFMGDIFGAPLALEALTAFFLESTFLGIWIFGWDKLSERLHCICIWIVAFASNLSAFWILVANSFMQHPVGFVIRNGRAEMTDCKITKEQYKFALERVEDLLPLVDDNTPVSDKKAVELTMMSDIVMKIK